jgi:isocitrate/isopropylmalate dehydrogenase
VAAAQSIRHAIDLALADPGCRTPDIRGSASTEGMTKAIIARIEHS